jgi:hypothetical protein
MGVWDKPRSRHERLQLI